ncbi:terminase small subunit [Levilactobacillus bambusae]|uniref:Terminase n=1 Tax=Levilactobacillus bambusae TaxID=2024736 RepID=A0A2V1N128_9LACO|nr:terminase small subunit [Levilactobacillus bambusae]PWG00969.1 terminase [Levilactobacillus bambusae]
MKKEVEQAKRDYMAGMKYRDISTKYNIPLNTLKSWKRRYDWQRGSKKKTQMKARGAPIEEKGAPLNTIQELEDSTLTEKQKLFCMYYLQRFNATWAYQKAYQVDQRTAEVAGSRLLRNVKVKKELDVLKQQQAVDLYLDANDILKEYAKQATASLGDVLDYKVYEEVLTDEEGMPFLDTDGNPIKRHQADVFLKPSDEIDWSVIQDLHVGKDGLIVKLYDKQKALHELVDRLPKPVNEDVEEDTFLKAIRDSVHQIKGEDD